MVFTQGRFRGTMAPVTPTAHAVPCCDGPCSVCGRRIRKDGMAAHMSEKHPSHQTVTDDDGS